MEVSKKTKIYVAGHNGMVGSAILRKLKDLKFQNLLVKNRSQLDLISQAEVDAFINKERPDCIIICAAKVGGIKANNNFPADFIYNNLQIQNNIIHSAQKYKVKKLIFLGSSCIYPKESAQPILEEFLLSGPLESTNEPYAIAKIAGIKLCESYYKQYKSNYYSLMPCNLYGPNDNFNLETSHVIPALINKFHIAKINNNSKVEVWGSGEAYREFLYVDDFADACIFCMINIDAKSIYDQGISQINIGSGVDLKISELALLIKDTVGYNGKIVFNKVLPDGTKRKLLNIDRISSYGWKAMYSLDKGLKETYKYFRLND